jgi:hypothetical protein
LRPAPIIAASGLVSFLAWAVPGSGLDRGYHTRTPFSLPGYSILIVWYVVSCAVAAVGHRMGTQVLPTRVLSNVDTRRVENILTVVATVGVAWTYSVVVSGASVAAALNARLGNNLTELVSDTAGPQTLRYAAPLATALVLRGVVMRERRYALLAWNLLLLAGTALLASRLSVVLCGLLFLFLIRDRIRLRPVITLIVVTVAGGVLFAATIPLNYVRNANTYEALGIYDPVLMNVSQVVAYLGAPTQVALGQANALYAVDPSTMRPWKATAVLPTYLQSTSANQTIGINGRYGSGVDVNASLTTNSVFADTLAHAGPLGLLSVLSIAFAASILIGHFRQYPGPASLAAGVLLYGFAEWWRTFVFTAGFLHFSFLLAVGACLLARPRKTRQDAVAGPPRAVRTARSR